MAEDDWESAADAAAAAPGGAPVASLKAAPAPAANSQWADEDAPEPEVEAPIAKGPPPPAKKKALSKAKLEKKEIEDVRKAEAEAKARAKDPKLAFAHKQAMQKLAEDGDKEIAESLFAGAGDDAPKREKRVQPDVLKTMELKTAAQFDQFAKDVANKVLPNDADKTRKDAVGFIKAFIKFAQLKLDSEDLRGLSSAMTVALNDKIKEEGSSKKKKGAKASAKPALKTLNSNANKSAADEQQSAASGNADEYDFL